MKDDTIYIAKICNGEVPVARSKHRKNLVGFCEDLHGWDKKWYTITEVDLSQDGHILENEYDKVVKYEGIRMTRREAEFIERQWNQLKLDIGFARQTLSRLHYLHAMAGKEKEKEFLKKGIRLCVEIELAKPEDLELIEHLFIVSNDIFSMDPEQYRFFIEQFNRSLEREKELHQLYSEWKEKVEDDT